LNILNNKDYYFLRKEIDFEMIMMMEIRRNRTENNIETLSFSIGINPLSYSGEIITKIEVRGIHM